MRRIGNRDLEERLFGLFRDDNRHEARRAQYSRLNPKTRGLPPRPPRLVLHLWEGELFVTEPCGSSEEQ